MFTIQKIQEKKTTLLELKNSTSSAKAIISLNEGGRLKELKFNDQNLIKDITDFNYENSYASSVLFPFPSRIENGKYTFNGNEYQLECNDNGKNALHGLIYNKPFSIIKKTESKNFTSVVIEYQEKEESKGFPYTYKVQLIYTLYQEEISLSVKIENTDNKPFPFALGWHPYFFNDDIKNCSLKFKSDKKIEFNENLITKKVIDYTIDDEFKIEDKQLDDCFILNSDVVEFSTPDYQIEISSNQVENYLQLYTPKDLPFIAIEPMTGVSNSFNNKIGLQILEPKNSISLTWSIKNKQL